jgi:hypothetical protein
MEAEKMRKEEPKQAPKQQFTPKPSAVYDDEETIIAEPKPKREEKKPEPKPEPKVFSQPTQSSYTRVSNNSNDSQGSGKGIIIAMIIAVLVVIIFANYRGCGNKVEEANQQSVENAEPKTVERMSWESPLGSCHYTGPVDEYNEPNGKGEAKFNDGRYYKGSFLHGSLTGKDAYFKYANGDTFEGEFRDNAFYFGEYTIADDKSYFVGYYKNGQPNGGTWFDKNGKVIQ